MCNAGWGRVVVINQKFSVQSFRNIQFIVDYSQHTRATALANHIAAEQSGNFPCNHSKICGPVVADHRLNVHWRLRLGPTFFDLNTQGC